MMRLNFSWALLSLPLLLILFSQSGSCHDSKMKTNSNNSNQTQNSNSAAEEKRNQLKGSWGGQGISMEVINEEANLNFDCARGTISEAMVPDSNGKFVVKGSFARERPGPTRESDDADELQATYSGVLDGNTLTLTITINRTRSEAGTFTLKQGQTGRIRRCL